MVECISKQLSFILEPPITNQHISEQIKLIVILGIVIGWRQLSSAAPIQRKN